MNKKSDRCVQCGWTIAKDRYEDVFLDGKRVPLHKGSGGIGCPRPDPLIHPTGYMR